jgi:hypothetical protein
MLAAANDDLEEPKNIEEAKASADWPHWLQGMKEEIQLLIKNGTFKAIDRQKLKGRKPLSTRWLYKLKRDENGKIARYKARLVVRGFEQRYGLDYDQTFAGVAKSATWRILFALAAINDWEIEQMDVKGAFLHGDIDEEVFIDLPDGWELTLDSWLPIFNSSEAKSDIVLQLDKALYGLKQSPRLWQLKLRKEMKKLGFFTLSADQSIYRHTQNGLILVTYVDDFNLIGPQGEELKKVKQDLSKVFDISDMGPCQYYLGIRVVRDRPNRRLYLCQDAYTLKTLEKFGMRDCKPVSTPLDPNSVLSLIPFEGQAPTDQIKLYQSMVGSINYLAV